jgi:hypothetical protein
MGSEWEARGVRSWRGGGGRRGGVGYVLFLFRVLINAFMFIVMIRLSVFVVVCGFDCLLIV